MTIEPKRIKLLNRRERVKGKYILYWMQQSQRAEYNHALEYAIEQADAFKQPLLVIFGLTDNYPEANLRHYAFMIQGLQETKKALEERGIKMIVRLGEPDQAVLEAGKNASLIVCDRGYLRHQRMWRRNLAIKADCPVLQIESDIVVPLEETSQNAEYAARTIRPKINRVLEKYLLQVSQREPFVSSLDMDISGEDISNMDGILERLNLDKSIPRVDAYFKGGTSEAKSLFKNFLKNKLALYDKNSNQPQTEGCSRMGPYLHFGQISPLWLALKVNEYKNRYPQAASAYIEELIVRRELSINFVYYTPNYDQYGTMPEWAAKTLAQHVKDRRSYIYSQETLTEAKTHDPYWNAAVNEMKYTGFMHNYMRMYWGKKVLEWSRTPMEAFYTLLNMNNRYFLDGRDPNSFACTGWIFGLHDRAWKEREIFGKVRYMAASGLERKCDIKEYVRRVERLQ